MARLALPPDAKLTADQTAACTEAVAGLRRAVPTPMIAWLRNPELARRAQRLGELLRFETTLDPRLSELAILACARHWTSHHEWTAHKRLALDAGLSPEVISDIAARRPPRFRDEQERVVHEASTTLLSTGHLPSPLYDRSLALLGEQGLVEFVGIVGYYCLVSLTLNAFELGLPENVAVELDDPTHPCFPND